MKVYNRTISFALAAGLLGLSSCDKFLDINQNPNAVLEAPPANVLVAGQSHLGFLMGSDLHRYTSLIAQQFSGQGGSGTQTAEYDRYNISATDLNNAWRGGIYGGAQADLQKLVNQTQATSPVYAGIAKIMQGFLFSVTADSFGDIPFTDALKFDQNLQPKYDASSDVYAGIIELLNSGIADLKKQSTFRPTADDLIYGGDVVKWEKLANTLKLRLYLHNYPNRSAAATAGIAAILASPTTMPVMTSVGDNFQLAFEGAANKNNSIDQFEKSRPNTFFPSATFVNLMNARMDPRRATFLTEFPAASGTYVGATNGTGAAGGPNTSFSRMGTYLRGLRTGTGANDYDGSAPIRMLTFAEHNFILAEYYARTGNLTSAQASYNAGITASMTMAGVASAAITTYLAARPALTATNAIQQIIEEKFIANFGVAVEPWTDYRRTGFPNLPLPVGALAPAILRVLPYPDLERVANPANTPARPDLTARTVFWDRM